MSLFDKMKEKLGEAGKGAQKLTRMGQLKLDLSNAESHLATRHKELGTACAQRFLDRGEPTVDGSESALAHTLQQIVHARNRIQEIEKELEELRQS